MIIRCILLVAFVLTTTIPVHAADILSEREFQGRVYGLLEKSYAGRDITRGEDPFLIKMDQYELGLQNLYNRYQQDPVSGADLDSMLEEHFSIVISQLEKPDRINQSTWAEVKDRLRAQVAPREFLDRAPMVHKPLDEYTIVAYVIDSEASYSYVSEKAFANWSITRDTLHETAVANLDAISSEVSMQGSLEDDKFIAVLQGDSYDAARLLIPAFRKFLASKLGSPFYAAIPNRDFLIAWSIDNSETFTRESAKQAEEDFNTLAYPLSPNVFLASEKEVRVAD